MFKSITLTASVFIVSNASFATDFTVTFQNWYQVKTNENGTPGNYINNGSTNLPSWLTISSANAEKAKVVVVSSSELNAIGQVTKNYSANGRLKWRVDASDMPMFRKLQVRWDAAGSALASVGAHATDCLTQARAEDVTSASGSKLLSRTWGAERDEQKNSRGITRTYVPSWTSSGAGAYVCYIHQDFLDVKGYSKVKINEAEEMLGATMPTPPTAAYAKGLVEFEVLDASDTPSLEEAYACDDGFIRIYAISTGTKEELVDLQLFTQNNVLIRATAMYVEEDSSFDFCIRSAWPAGTYKLFAKPNGGLRKRTDLQFNGSSPLTPTITYLWGDVDGDNEVTLTDLNNIEAYLGLSSNDPEWYFWKEGFKADGAGCDLNRDNRVDNTDLTMAQQNIGLLGD